MFARYVVTGVAGQVGAVFGPSEFLAAHDCAKREGALFGVTRMGDMLAFDPVAKRFASKFAAAPIGVEPPELAVALADKGA
jgi:hypothetical protein